MAPSILEVKSTPVFSCTGRPSMSARRSTAGRVSAPVPAAWPRSTAVTDVVSCAQGDLVAEPVECLEHLLLGAGQRQADLGLPVQLVAEPGKVRLHFPGVCGDRHVFSSVVGSAFLRLF